MRSTAVILAIALCCLGAAAQAEVYTWVDAQGVRHYSNSPAAKKAHTVDLWVGQQKPSGETKDGSATAAADVEQRLTILRPNAGATLKSAKGLVGVSIAVAGGLGADEKLVYYLDGQTVAESPTRARQFQLLGLAPGPHALQVVLKANGRETGRTQPIAFTVKIVSADKAAKQ